MSKTNYSSMHYKTYIMVAPIKFELEESNVQDYHLVHRKELHEVHDPETLKRCIDELNLRVRHATKHFKSRYDQRHTDWMRTLARPLKVEHKVDLALDAIVAVSKKSKTRYYNHKDQCKF